MITKLGSRVALAPQAKPHKVTFHWGQSAPKAVWISNLVEEQGKEVAGHVEVPAFGVVTLRAELP
jgi:hypothetical protein